MSHDNKSNYPGASLDATNPVSGNFNQSNYWENKIATLPPEAQEKCRFIQEIGAIGIEKMKKNQQENHDKWVRDKKAELLEKYLKDQSLRPESIRQNPEQDLKVIQEQAERLVQEKSTWYLQNIQRATNANLRNYIEMEKESQQQREHSDHEQGH